MTLKSIFTVGLVSLAIQQGAFATTPLVITAINSSSQLPAQVYTDSSASGTYQVTTGSAQKFQLDTVPTSFDGNTELTIDSDHSDACKVGSIIDKSTPCKFYVQFSPAAEHTVSGSLQVSAFPYRSNVLTISSTGVKRPAPPTPSSAFVSKTRIYVGHQGILTRIPGSNNVVNWYNGTNNDGSPLTAETFNSVSYGKKTNGEQAAVAVGNDGKIYSSTNAVTWTARTSNISDNLNSIAFGHNTWVTVGDNGNILYSLDGTTWINATISGLSGTPNLTKVLYYSNRFMAIGQSGTVLTSINGITWSTVSLPNSFSEDLNDITVLNDKLHISTKGIFTSDYGTSWSKMTSPGTSDLTFNQLTFLYAPHGRNLQTQYAGLASDQNVYYGFSPPSSLLPNFTVMSWNNFFNNTRIADHIINAHYALSTNPRIDTLLAFVHSAANNANPPLVANNVTCGIVQAKSSTAAYLHWDKQINIDFSFPDCTVSGNTANNVSPFFSFSNSSSQYLQDIDLFYHSDWLHGLGVDQWQATDLSKSLPFAIPTPIKAATEVD